MRASGVLVVAAGLTAATVCAAAQSSPAPATAKDGVYTTAQAERGNDAYTTSCAHCHASDLQGDVRQEIPALVENDFFVRWGNRTLGEIYDMISKDMPADKPGSLTSRKAADILAYILSVNGFPAGPAELPADAERLKAIDLGTK